MPMDLLVATSEAQHAVRWSVVDGDQPGVTRLSRKGARSAGRGRPIRTPANFESRSATVPRVGPPMRGRQGSARGADRISRGRLRWWRDPGLRRRVPRRRLRSWRGTRGAPRGSFCPAGPALLAGWPSTSSPFGIPSNIVLADLVSVPPGLAKGRGSRRAPAASQLVNANRMCDAGDASRRTRAAAQGR